MGGVPVAPGLAPYGDGGYGEPGCEAGPSVLTRLFGGSVNPDCDPAGDGLACGGEYARGGTCD